MSVAREAEDLTSVAKQEERLQYCSSITKEAKELPHLCLREELLQKLKARYAGWGENVFRSQIRALELCRES